MPSAPTVILIFEQLGASGVVTNTKRVLAVLNISPRYDAVFNLQPKYSAIFNTQERYTFVAAINYES